MWRLSSNSRSDGSSALFSSLPQRLHAGILDGFNDSAYYGFTPAIAVDSSGNIDIVGDLGGSPQTFPLPPPYH